MNPGERPPANVFHLGFENWKPAEPFTVDRIASLDRRWRHGPNTRWQSQSPLKQQ